MSTAYAYSLYITYMYFKEKMKKKKKHKISHHNDQIVVFMGKLTPDSPLVNCLLSNLTQRLL